ncbi:hypothetical protein [Colwellia sp. E150_009]|jgi:hypothetical protein|tara:strand:- start:1217 stop:1429 length:213 start_codon:yes stop_codon:yes gene_type:complete
MSEAFRIQAQRLNKMIDANNATQAHLYLEQLLLFPVDIQDKIIDEISHLGNCNSDDVAKIINRYSIIDLR